MKDYLKVLPLCLVMSSSFVFAGDIADNMSIDDMKTSQENIEKALTLKKIEREYIQDVQFKNTFVNVEVQEVIVQNVKKSFDEIDKGVKATGDQMALDSFFQSLGKVQETNVFNFTNVATNQKVNFDNAYIRKYAVDTRTADAKNNSTASSYKSSYRIVESSNSYKFEMYLDRLGDKAMRVNINGDVNTEYGTSDESVKDNVGRQRSGMSNSFKQDSLLKINEYTILSSDVKDAGVDNKTRESRFFIIKVNEMN